MHVRLKLLHACGRWHSSQVSTFLTSSYCKLRPNTEGAAGLFRGIGVTAMGVPYSFFEQEFVFLLPLLFGFPPLLGLKPGHACN
jgi:hypothetical protein